MRREKDDRRVTAYMNYIKPNPGIEGMKNMREGGGDT
jgi:hypothetical protein